MLKLERILQVNVYDEYMEGPSHARVVLDDSLVKRIRQLNQAVKKLKTFRIEEFDCTPDFLKGDPEEGEELQEWDDGSIDLGLLCVNSGGFLFTGYVKHTDVRIETEEIGMKELSENIKVMKSKSLPLLIGHLKYESSRTLLEKRLKGEPCSVKES